MWSYTRLYAGSDRLPSPCSAPASPHTTTPGPRFSALTLKRPPPPSYVSLPRSSDELTYTYLLQPRIQRTTIFKPLQIPIKLSQPLPPLTLHFKLITRRNHRRGIRPLLLDVPRTKHRLHIRKELVRPACEGLFFSSGSGFFLLLWVAPADREGAVCEAGGYVGVVGLLGVSSSLEMWFVCVRGTKRLSVCDWKPRLV